MIKNSLFLILFFCCFGHYCNSQSRDTDKLITKFESNVTDSVKLQVCKMITSELARIDSAKAELYIQKGIALSLQLADDESSLFFESQKARVLVENGRLKEAEELIESIVTQAEANGFEQVLSNCYQILITYYFNEGNMIKTSEYMEKVLAVYQRTGKQHQSAQMLSNLGVIYVELGELDTALDRLNESIPIMEQLNDESGIAKNIRNLGIIYFTKGLPEKALEYYENSLKIEERINNEEGIATCLYEISIAHVELENYNLATHYSKRSIKLHQQLGETFYVILSTAQIGTNFMGTGKYDLALTYLNDAINQAKAIKNHNLVTNISMDLGQLYLHQGNFDQGIEYLINTLDSIRNKGDKSKVLTLLNNIGHAYKAKGKVDSAFYYFRLALQHNDSTMLPEQSISLSNIGFCFLEHLDNEDSAFYYLNQANEIYLKSDNKRSLRKNLEKTGSWYTSQGKIPKALSFYDQALKIVEESGDTLGMAQVYNDLAYVHETQKNWNKAISYQEKALLIYELTSDASAFSKTEMALAELYVQQGSYQQAINLALRAQNNFQKLQDSCQLSSSHLVLGTAFSSLLQPDSAIYYLEKSSLQSKKCNFYVISAQSNIELGKIYAAKGQSSRAFTLYEKALDNAKISRDRQSIQEAAAFLFPIYQQKRDFEKAFETLNLYQSNRDSLFNIENTRNLVQKEMEIAYAKAEQKKALLQQKEDALTTQKLARQQWVIYTSVGAFIAMVLIALAVYRNYRNKQKANIQLQHQKKELEELDHLKSRLFANISHELRTPLTLIGSPVESLISSNETYSPATRQKLELVKRNSQQLKGLVDDILDLSKLESNKIDLYEEKVALSPLISRIFSNFESLALHLGIRYTIQMEDMNEKWAVLDIAKVEKILNNLLSNAIKHTPSGKEVALRVQLKNQQIQLQIIDSGNGIAAVDLPHIFDRFFQSKQPDAPIQGGTGIGLALAKELTHLMNGDIRAVSEEGKGSIFTVIIPYKPTEPTAEITILEEEISNEISVDHLLPDEIAESEKKFHVLVVEDHPDMQQFLNGLLLSKYYLHLANNGKKALEILKVETVDLIISDVMMPEMDGYALLEQLKSNEHYRHIPVIMLTALDTKENKLNALTLGVDDYLTKPFSPEELLARAYNLLLRYESRMMANQLILEESDTGELEGVALYPEEDDDQIPIDQDSDLEWLEKIAEAIRQELENPDFQVIELAEQFHMSERQFYRKMKKITGMTPRKYQQEVALQKARYLLENKQLGNVTAVCYAVGMSNVSRFSQLYLARFGKKPKDYFNAAVS